MITIKIQIDEYGSVPLDEAELAAIHLLILGQNRRAKEGLERAEREEAERKEAAKHPLDQHFEPLEPDPAPEKKPDPLKPDPSVPDPEGDSTIEIQYPDGYAMRHQDEDVAIRTIAGEARGEVFSGQVAVGLVIINRWKSEYRGKTKVRDVVLDPWQFSCWNPDDPNQDYLDNLTSETEVYRTAKRAWRQAIDQHFRGEDTTGGSRHYHSTKIGFPPSWGEYKAPTTTIGNHHFYNNVA